jgi:hypothetical protein
MGKSFRQCPACSKRALSIATRCPACGQELLEQPVQREPSPDRGRFPSLLAVAAVVLAAGALIALLVQRSATRGAEATASAAIADEPPTALDTVHAAASPVMRAVPDSGPSAEAVTRVARTWTKVHERRSVNGELAAVLLPGDTVLADSLRGGWWRVALEGRVVGYVYAPTLAEAQ